ncbi:MAG TPA: cytochrome c maturation protein CcmE [Methylomirabilota bacterium]|nr:cytochrome c maturation protein CcmE [Methylomirabilota bacterium]
MTRRARRFVLGGAVIALALGGLVLTGVRQSVVYFVTPSELRAATSQAVGRAYRLGGMVVPGSLRTDAATLRHDFVLTDGKATLPVHFRGIPPDLFAEGRGAVVEGTLASDGTFQASTIMAKHSEEYRAPRDAQTGYQELLRTLRGNDPARGGQPGT